MDARDAEVSPTCKIKARPKACLAQFPSLYQAEKVNLSRYTE